MILLFNKVYLKSDLFFKSERNRIYISSRHPQSLLDAGVRGQINGVRPTNPLMAAENYQQLLTDQFNGNEDRFFVTLLSYDPSKRVTIYGSMETLLRIATKLWKTLFPRMTSDQYLQLVHFTLLHHLELFGQRGTSIAQMTPSESAELRQEIQGLMECYDELGEVWNFMTPLSLTRQQREALLKGVAIEYHLPTLLLNPTWRYASVAKDRFVSMAQKAAIGDFVMDVKHALLANLELIHSVDPTCTFNSLTDTLDQFVAANPKYGFLVDPNFTPERMVHVKSTYNLDELAQIDAMCSINGVRASTSWQPLLKSGLTFDQYLTHLIDDPRRAYGLGDGEYQEKTNPVLLSYLVASYASGDTSKLQPYVMG